MHFKYICSLWFIYLPLGGLVAQPVTIDKIIAKVNQHIILKSELEEQFLGAQSRSTGLSQCEILESMIHNKVLVSRAELDSIPLSEEAIEQNLDNRLSYVIAQVGSEAKIQELYGKSVRDFKEELREAVRDQMLIEQMRETLIGNLKVSPREVRAFFEAIPEEKLPYYSTEVRLGHIIRIPKPSAFAEQATEEELRVLRRRILEGEAFKALARRYSEDPSAVHNEGHLGFYRRGELDPAYEAAALRLDVGDISLPVRSSFGYHLIELLEIKGNTYDSRHILLTPKPTEADYMQSRAFLDSLRKDILEEEISFEAAAQEHSEDPQTSLSGGFFKGTGANPFISVEDLDPLLFFVLDTMEVGTLSFPHEFTTEDGKKALRLLYYKEKIAPHQAALSTDYLKLQNAAIAEKEEKILDKWLKSAHQEMYIFIDSDYSRCDAYHMANQTQR